MVIKFRVLLFFFSLIIECSFSTQYLKASSISPQLPLFSNDGVIVGGKAQFDILLKLDSVLVSKTKNNTTERLIFSFDHSKKNGQPINHLGYYHVSLKTKSLRRLSMNLHHVIDPSFDKNWIKNILQASDHLTNIKFFHDYLDNSLNITLQFNKLTTISISELISHKRPSQIVLDVRSVNE